MTRFIKALLLVIPTGCMLLAQTPATPTAPDNKAAAYYNFAMGRLYIVMASSQGNKNDYVSKAIQHYQEALKLDPTSGLLFEELTDLYVQTNRVRDAVTLAEDVLKQNPNNLDARRMLGRVYTQMAGQNQAGKIDEQYLKRAVEQYEKVTSQAPNDAESWVMLGRLYVFSNNSPEAEKAFNSALKADPDSEDALTQLALLYANLGDSKRAIEKLKAVSEKSPNERIFGVLAEQYRQLRDFKSAAEVLRKAQEIQPDNPKIARELAMTLMEGDDLDEALKIFQQLAAQDPRDASIALSMVDIYRAKRDLVKAREALNNAKAIDPRSFQVRFQDVRLLEAEGKTTEAIAAIKGLLDDTARRTYDEQQTRIRASLLDEYGILLRGAEQYAQAIAAFKQMGDFGGDHAKRSAVQIIDTYRQSRDYATALREADAALKKYPGERMIKIEHATVLADSGKVDEAAAELRGLLSGDGQRGIYLALAQIYEKAKRYPDMGKVLDEWEKLPAAKEDAETIHFMRGAMYERMKKFDASEAEFRKVLAMNAENPGALNYLGYMLADRNVRLDEAYQMIRKALDMDPDNAAYLDSLGWVYYRQGKLSDAEAMLVRSIQKMAKGDATVHDHLGDVYFKQGKIREAVVQWQNSIKEFQTPGTDADPEEVAKVNRKLNDARGRLAQETKRPR
jgi:tetratricopeptide (TPR) repeat protein